MYTYIYIYNINKCIIFQTPKTQVLLGEVLATVRDEDLDDQIALLKDCMGSAADGENALAQVASSSSLLSSL